MLRKFSLSFLCSFLFILQLSGHEGGAVIPATNSHIRFTENKNQWPGNILYRAQLDGGVLFLEAGAFTYNFYDKETLRKNHRSAKAPSEKTTAIASHAFRMSFPGANLQARTRAEKPTKDHCNYFIGNDPSKWASGVKNYTEVIYEELYPWINLQVLGLDNSLKY